jgi:hypothetical protein
MAMALDLPTQPPSRRDGPHPAICLLAGFGVIILGALVVHIVFNVLV